MQPFVIRAEFFLIGRSMYNLRLKVRGIRFSEKLSGKGTLERGDEIFKRIAYDSSFVKSGDSAGPSAKSDTSITRNRIFSNAGLAKDRIFSTLYFSFSENFKK